MRQKAIASLSKHHGVLIGIVVLYLITGVSLRPFFDSPSNDDWAYGWSVRHFIQTGEMRVSDWAAPIIVVPALWGSLFSKLFGFSFTTLKLSTAVLSLAALVGFYLLLKEADLPESHCAFAVLVLLFNPIYLWASFNFMTEAPFLCFLIFSVLFYLKHAKGRGPAYLLLASLFCSLAVLTRQTGALVFFATAVFYYLRNREDERVLGSRREFLLWLLPGIVFLYVFEWYRFIHGATQGYTLSNSGLLDAWSIVERFPERVYALALYTGFFCLPVFFFSLPGLWKALRARHTLVSLVLSLTLLSWLYGAGYLKNLPYLDNILNRYGIGPSVFWVVAGNRPLFLPEWAWTVMTILSLMGGAVIFALLVDFLLTEENLLSGNICVVWLIGVLQFLFILMTPLLFDRYLLITFPFACLFLLSRLREPAIESKRLIAASRACGVAALLIYGVLAWVGVFDYYAWSRARMELYHDLVARSVSPRVIDGGLEWNCWRLFNQRHANPATGNQSWWETANQQALYRISFSPLAGCEIVSVRHFFTPMRRRLEPFYLLKIKSGQSPDASDSEDKMQLAERYADQGQPIHALREYEKITTASKWVEARAAMDELRAKAFWTTHIGRPVEDR